MRSLLVLGRASLAAMVVAAAVLAESAGWSGGSAHVHATAGRRPSPSQTPISYTFQTVEPDATTNDRVTGIDDSNHVVGVDGSACPSSSDPYVSFYSKPPYTSFTSENYPNANGTYLTSISSGGGILAGFVCYPKSNPAVWGLVKIKGNWTIIRPEPNEPKSGSCKVMELLGIDDANDAAAFYEDSACVAHAIEETGPSEGFTAYKPPNALSAEATGITDGGVVVGTQTVSGNTAVGWYAPNGPKGQYATFSYPGSAGTQTYAMNAQGYVVGSYQDSSSKTHGFLLTNPGAPPSQQNWQEIVDPKAIGLTVVSGINDQDDICGWYKGAEGRLHGFVAMPSASQARRT